MFKKVTLHLRKQPKILKTRTATENHPGINPLPVSLNVTACRLITKLRLSFVWVTQKVISPQ